MYFLNCSPSYRHYAAQYRIIKVKILLIGFEQKILKDFTIKHHILLSAIIWLVTFGKSQIPNENIKKVSCKAQVSVDCQKQADIIVKHVVMMNGVCKKDILKVEASAGFW